MYEISTTVPAYKRMLFSSLVAAVTKAKQLRQAYPERIFDVMRRVDRDTIRVVYAYHTKQGYNRPVWRIEKLGKN